MTRLMLTMLSVSLLSLAVACEKKPKQPLAPATEKHTANTAEFFHGRETTRIVRCPAVAPAPVPPSPPPPPKPVVIPAGTVVTVRLSTALGSKSSKTGDPFEATVAQPVEVGGKALVPSGAPAAGTVVEAKAKGKIKGEARLKLALNKVTIKGKTYLIQTTMGEQTAKGKGRATAVATGGGAAGGALIGGIAGGGKGAGIGLLVGAGAGFIAGTMTGNKQIDLPAETVLSFQLTESITLR